MKPSAYETLDPGGGTAMVRTESRDRLKRVGAIVFDCDGTLVDARRSYDTTVMRTVRTMLEGFSGVDLPVEDFGGELILKIRRTGGFNSDWDTTYALSLLAEAAVERCRSEERAEVGRITAILERLIGGFSSRNRLAGRSSVDRFLSREGLASETLMRFRRYLGFGGPLQSKMAATFDQIYYGGTLYREIYGVKPAVWYDEGLIEMETLFLGLDDIRRFQRIVGKRRMAMATGRPYVAVKHALGPLLRYFERDASTFIGDGDIYPELAPELESYRKPSGASLIKARRMLSAGKMLYIGDSAEDRLMVDDARSRYRDILFAGIYGSSFNEESQISYFSRTESDLVVRSVDQVPAVLEMIAS